MSLERLPLFKGLFGYDKLSDIIIRPKHVSGSVEERISCDFPNARILRLELTDDSAWPAISKSLSDFFSFPSSVEHSIDAFEDWLRDLSWLDDLHYIILVDVSKIDYTSRFMFYVLDVVTRSTAEHNRRNDVKLTWVLFI